MNQRGEDIGSFSVLHENAPADIIWDGEQHGPGFSNEENKKEEALNGRCCDAENRTINQYQGVIR